MGTLTFSNLCCSYCFSLSVHLTADYVEEIEIRRTFSVTTDGLFEKARRAMWPSVVRARLLDAALQRAWPLPQNDGSELALPLKLT